MSSQNDDENEPLSAWQREASTTAAFACITLFLGTMLLWVKIIEILGRVH